MNNFFYECFVCKEKIPATIGKPDPENMQIVIVDKKDRSESTFRCEKCRS